MSLLLASTKWAHFCLDSRDSSLTSHTTCSILRYQLLLIPQPAITTTSSLKGFQLQTSSSPIRQKSNAESDKASSPGTGPLFPYQEYYVLAIPTLGYYKHSLTFKCQAEFTGPTDRNKQNKTFNVLTEKTCFRIAQITKQWFPRDHFYWNFSEHSCILKLLQQIHNSNPMFCFKTKFQPYKLIKATTWSELAFKLISFVSLIHMH